MGIPRFSTRLKAYAEHGRLGSTKSPAKDAVAIIDGPGLAHYIYHRTRHPQNGRISYAKIAEAAAEWLTELQAIGYRIEAILFDGALPASKRDIRIQRLQDYILKVQSYKQNLGSSPLILSATRSLPPPTFLVFSFVEELLANEAFAGVTYVVPGEADPYCVAAAQSLRANGLTEIVTIFSDDADLLVYELDSHTCVAPFRDLSSSLDGRNTIWTGDLYWSAKISQRGSRKNLIEPAFFMAEDPHRTLVDAFGMSAPSDQTDFVQFASDFQTSKEIVQWQHIKADSEMKQSMAQQDSRISEFLWGCKNDADGLRMFLPFLIDDPSRATAWNIGSEVRKLAYSVAKLSSGADADVQEYRRSGERLVSTLTESQSTVEVLRQVSELQTYLDSVISWAREGAKLPGSGLWQYVALQQTLQFLHHEGYTLPSVDDLVRVVTMQEERKWRLIHLSAQWQAAYYSLRMLKQVLRYSRSGVEVKAQLGEEVIGGLWERLEGLPSIAGFMSIPESPGEEKQERQRWGPLMSDLLITFQGSEPEPESKRRKTSKKRKKGGGDEGGTLSRNPYALLADE